LVDNNGCVGKDTVFVDSSCPFFIPTAFTPNGDGINDEYKIITNGATAFRMAIYNRWGERIFITKDGSKGWDGTFEGKPEEMGTYIYELQVVFDNGVSRVSKGNITLIR
jgi:gliding motility-associated-like protein